MHKADSGGGAVQRRLFKKNAKLDVNQVKDYRPNTTAKKMLLSPIMGDFKMRYMHEDSPQGLEDFIRYSPSRELATRHHYEQLMKNYYDEERKARRKR